MNYQNNKFVKVVIIILLFICSNSFAKTLTENDIKEMAKQINDKLIDLDFSNGIKMKGCTAFNRTLIYQYEVNEYWYPIENMKEILINNIKEAGNAEFFFNNDIDIYYYYYYDKNLVKKIQIESNELCDLNFELGDYISIKGHSKAKDVDLKIQCPIGWKIEEGQRPHIVKKFVYNNSSYIIIIVDNITFFSRNEVRELFEDENYIDELIREASSFLTNAEILNQGVVTIESYPTIVFTIKGEAERSGVKINLIMKNWIIFYEDKIIYLQCAGINNYEFFYLENIFNLITNSIIFPEQYNY